MKIVTLTLNPCFDTTLGLEGFHEDDVNRTVSESCQAAGKGVNVSRVLANFGIPTTALIIAGEENLREYDSLLENEGFETEYIKAPGKIRENLTLATGEKCFKINRQGFAAEKNTALRIITKLEQLCDRESLLVISGSRPKNFSWDELYKITDFAHSRSINIAIDMEIENIEALKRLSPWLIKPNEHELSKLISNFSDDSLDKALAPLLDSCVTNILLTRGARGVNFYSKEIAFYQAVPRVGVKSTVGAGDSSLAGFLFGISKNMGLEDCIKHAALFGTATVMQEGTGLVTPQTVKLAAENFRKAGIKNVGSNDYFQ